MKCHLIVGVFIVLILFLDVTFAGKRRGFFHFGQSQSVPRTSRNHPLNRRLTSSEVKAFSFQRSRFRSVSPEAPSRPATVPASSKSSRFERLRLSPVSRRPSSSVAQSGNSAKPIKPEGSKTRIQNQLPIDQTKSVNQPTDRTSRPSQIVRSRSVDNPPRPTLQQLATSARNSRSPTRSGNLPPPVRNPSRNPPPLSSFRYPSLPPVHNPPANLPPASATNPPAQVGNPVPGPSGSQPPAQVGNPVPGPSGSQPPAPAALVQAGAAPAPGSRAAAKAAKAQAKQNRINKSQANAQSALQQTNANIGTCKDKNAPPNACFDFFVLSISWGPAMKIKRLGPVPPINKPEWGIHGLWPSLKTYNKLPKSCNLKIPYDPKEILTIQDALEDRWFSANGSPKTNQAFWQHEWDKHGTCAARSPQIKSVKQYFKKGLELFNQANVQAKLTAANFRAKKEMTNREMHDEISRILGHRVTLEPIDHLRTNDLWLSEIRLCYDFNFHLINCPPDTKTLNTANEDTKMIYSL